MLKNSRRWRVCFVTSLQVERDRWKNKCQSILLIPIPEENRADVLAEDKQQLLKAKKELDDLDKLAQKINTFIQENNLTESLQTNLTEEGLFVTILDNALFDSGSATIKPESQEICRNLSNLLVTNPSRKIVIAGHTDNVPISTKEFSSNWVLSSFRAINFMLVLLENPNLKPSQFSASGYGEHQPKADNISIEGRSKNRRVEVLIQPNIDLKALK